MSDFLSQKNVDALMASQTRLEYDDEDTWIIDWYGINKGVNEMEQKELEEEERQAKILEDLKNLSIQKTSVKNCETENLSETFLETLKAVERQSFIADAGTDDEITFLIPQKLPEIQTQNADAPFEILRPEVLKVITEGLQERTVAKYCK